MVAKPEPKKEPVVAKPEPKKEPVVAKPVKVEAPPAAPVAKTAAQIFSFPIAADVTGAMAVPGFDPLFATIKAKATKYGVPFPVTKEIIFAKAMEASGLKSMDWLATDKPTLVLSFNPKKSSNNGVFMVPITSKDKVIAALPEGHKKGEQNEFLFETPVLTLYVNFIDGHAVVSVNQGDFKAYKTVIEGAAKTYKPEGVFDLRLAANNLRTIFGPELAALKGQVEQLKPMIVGELYKEMPPGMSAGLEKMADFYIGMVNTLIDEADGIKLVVALDDKGNIRVPLTVEAKAGGKIATFAGALEKADPSYGKNAPGESWLLFGSHIDPKAFGGLMDYATDMLGSLLKMDDTEKKRLSSLFDTMLNEQDGRSWVAFYNDGKFPLSFASSASVKDGKKIRAAFEEYMSLVMTKGFGMVKELLPPQLQGLPTSDFTALVNAVGTMAKPFGVALAAGTETQGDITIQKLTIAIDLAALEATSPEAATKAKEVTNVIGTRLEFAIAYGPKHMAAAMGPNAVKHATTAASGQQLAGGSAGVVGSYGPGTAFFANMDLGRALKAFRPIMNAAGAGAEIPEIPAGARFGVSMSGKGNTVSIQVDAALDEFVGIGMKAFMTRAADPESSNPFGDTPTAKEAPAPAEPAKVEPAKPAPAAAGGDLSAAAKTHADTVCACKDLQCASKAMQAMGKWAGTVSSKIRTPADAKSLSAEVQRAGKCVQKAAGM